jgi:hypothetical protein
LPGINEPELDLPKAHFKNVVNIGKSSTKPKLEQILEQLEVPYSDFIWWNSSNKIKVTIPPELYVQVMTTSRASIHVDKESMQRAKGMSVKINSKASLLTHQDPKLMITKNMLILFFVDAVHKKVDKKKAQEGSSDDDWDFAEVEKLTLV